MPNEFRENLNTTLAASTEQVINMAVVFIQQRVPEDPYQVHIDDLLNIAQDIARLAETISFLNQQYRYSECLTLVRSLLEKSFHFYTSVSSQANITYSIVQDDEHLARVNAIEGVTCRPHRCGNDRGGICCVIIQENTVGGHPVLPGLRFVTLNSRSALTHSFPAGYRRELWSYIEESQLRGDFIYWRKHYLDWKAHLETATLQNLINEGDKALMQSHHGFLSAIAHSPVSLVDELHGQNAAPRSHNLITERLVLLYLYSLLGLVYQPLVTRARELGFWTDDFTDQVEAALENLELARSELHFPFSLRHPFDEWQANNVRMATEQHSLGFNDLDLEHLTDNFLYRLHDLHAGNFEISTGQVWVPYQIL